MTRTKQLHAKKATKSLKYDFFVLKLNNIDKRMKELKKEIKQLRKFIDDNKLKKKQANNDST